MMSRLMKLDPNVALKLFVISFSTVLMSAAVSKVNWALVTRRAVCVALAVVGAAVDEVAGVVDAAVVVVEAVVVAVVVVEVAAVLLVVVESIVVILVLFSGLLNATAANDNLVFVHAVLT